MTKIRTMSCVGSLAVAMSLLFQFGCSYSNNPAKPDDNDSVVGSGIVVTESRSVSDFRGVAVSGVGRVILENTGTESLTITAEDNILPLLESKVRNGVLTLGPRPNTNLSPTREIVYRMTFRDLSSLQASGVTDINAADIETNTLSVDASGLSNITVAGTADRQTTNISGTSTYSGEKLATRVTTVIMSGVSRAVVNVNERLEGVLSGSAVLEYIGNPVTSVIVSGSAAVRPH